MTQREYKQALYQLNREARLAQMRRYYLTNRERLIEYQRRYRAAKKAAAA